MGEREVGMPRAAVFLDRDGVLNRAKICRGRPHPPSSAAEVEIVLQAPSALRRLKDAGYVLVIVTNQPDVARGVARLSEVKAINAAVTRAMPIDAVEMCIHDDADRCDCRKPKPGMLTRAAARLELDLQASVMVGDRWRDIEAGRAAGCRTILVGDGYGEEMGPSTPDVIVQTIAEATEWILANRCAPRA